MNCLEAQKSITPFINDQLTMAQLNEFLGHIRECSECREELEVYYALLTAMKLLDEDKDLSDNFLKDLKAKLRMSEDKIRKNKMSRIRRRISFSMIIVGFIIASSYSIRRMTYEQPIPRKPSFLIQYYGVPSYLSPIKQMIEFYNDEARLYSYNKRKGERNFHKLWRDNILDYELFRIKTIKDEEKKKEMVEHERSE